MLSRSGVAWLIAAVLAAAGGCGAGPKIVLPAGFPADVPLPERATLRTARDLGMKGLNVVFESPLAVREHSRGLGGRMRAAGWAMVSEAEVDGAVFSSWRKGERSVALGVSRAGDVTTVGIAVVERPYNEWEEQG